MASIFTTIQRPDYTGVVGYSVERDMLDVDVRIDVEQVSGEDDVCVTWIGPVSHFDRVLSPVEANAVQRQFDESAMLREDAVQALRDNNEWRYDTYEPARVL